MLNKDRAIHSGLIFTIFVFIIAGLLGVLMRYAFVGELPEWISYRNITHTHSHLAMMGWIYGALYLLIVVLFDLDFSRFQRLFWITMLTVVGMLVSFPVQGYGMFSIIFTSLHLILSYFFILKVFKAIGGFTKLRTDFSYRFLASGLGFLFLSTLGTWMLAYIMKSELKGSPLYYGSVQFFLHFQFNGWFIFTVLGLCLRFFESKNLSFSRQRLSKFYWFLIISCLLTYALAITWSTPDQFLFWTNSLGVILQFVALYYFLKIALQNKANIKSAIEKRTYQLITLSLACFSFKILIQTLVAIPYLATISYTVKNFVIGFIHLLMLGSISTFLLAMINEFFPQRHSSFDGGVNIFLVGFLLSEFILFFQGLMLWLNLGFLPFYYLTLMLVSALMPLGILLVLAGIFKR